MAIKQFILSLLVLAIGLLIATVIFTPIKTQKNRVLPDVTFINSIMYDLNDKEVTQLVKSKKAYHYKTKEELYNATIILKSQKDKNRLTSDTVSANFIEITNKVLKFRGDVIYNRSTGTTLQSQALDYDRINEHLTGDKKFIAFYEGNKLKGNSLSIKKDRTIFKSTNNTPIKLNIIMNDKKEKNNETN